MPTARVTFRRCIQDSQEYGSTDEHMVSRLFFSLHVGGQSLDDLYVDIKQGVGSSFESGPIEVGPIRGQKYRGPFNHQAFRDAAETYYRSLVGAQGGGIRIEGATNIRMRNNRFEQLSSIEFEVAGPDVAW